MDSFIFTDDIRRKQDRGLPLDVPFGSGLGDAVLDMEVAYIREVLEYKRREVLIVIKEN